MSTNTKRECPHCHGSLERYEDPKAVAMIADLETKLAEAVAFTKHVGAATFAEARDVLLRSGSQYQDTIAEQFDQIKATAKERDEARIALSAASGIFAQITQSLTKERDEALAALDASNEARETVAELETCLYQVLYARFPMGAKTCDYLPPELYQRSYEALEKIAAVRLGGGGGFSPSPTPCEESRPNKHI